MCFALQGTCHSQNTQSSPRFPWTLSIFFKRFVRELLSSHHLVTSEALCAENVVGVSTTALLLPSREHPAEYCGSCGAALQPKQVVRNLYIETLVISRFYTLHFEIKNKGFGQLYSILLQHGFGSKAVLKGPPQLCFNSLTLSYLWIHFSQLFLAATVKCYLIYAYFTLLHINNACVVFININIPLENVALLNFQFV